MFKKVIAIAMAATMAFSVAPVATVATTAKAESIKTPTDLSRISKKPVLSYTFDGNDKDLKLNGTAKVENGVLTIAEMPVADEDNKKNGYGVNYAQIGSLANYDFSKGFSWTMDLNVSTWTYQWTSPLLLGNGTLGVGTKKGEVGYHFTLGLDNVMDLGKSEKNGTDNKKYGVYGGGQISTDDVYHGGTTEGQFEGYAPLAAPYTWDWFKDSTKCNQWYSITVTVSPSNELKMYINGDLIQSAADDGYGTIKTILDNVNKFTNNLLGATYWGPLGNDIDFKGQMDNVAFYNEVLTAEEAKALTTKDNKGQTAAVANTKDETPKSQYKTCALTDYEADCNSKEVVAYLSATASKVAKSTVTVNGKAAKSYKANGKILTAKLSKKLKKGDKVVITIAGEGYNTVTKKITVKGVYKLSKVKAKKGTKKVTGTVSAKKAKVQVKVGKKKYKKAKVKGKKFTFKCASLKKGTKVKVKVSGKGYVTLTKTYKVK